MSPYHSNHAEMGVADMILVWNLGTLRQLTISVQGV